MQFQEERRRRLIQLDINQMMIQSAGHLEHEQFSLLVHECTDPDTFQAIKRYVFFLFNLIANLNFTTDMNGRFMPER